MYTKHKLSLMLWRVYLVSSALFVLWFLLSVIVPVFVASVPKDSTKVYDSYSQLLYESKQFGSRTAVTLSDIPEVLRDGVVTIEDHRFYEHNGVDVTALFGAVLDRLTTGSSRGASTITSQVVKSIYFRAADRTYIQKGREFLLALLMERLLSKEQILTIYLNNSYFANNTYGVEAASWELFAKPASALSTTESAMLIGLLPAPEVLNPKRTMSKAIASRNNVLSWLAEDGVISVEDATLAKETSVTLAKAKDVSAPHFVQYVLEEAKQRYPDLLHGGYQIYTTVNPYWTQELSNIISKHVSYLAPKHVTNASGVVIDPHTGAIKVMIGSKDFYAQDIDGQFNVATALRQPGSSLKPFTYLASFFYNTYFPGSIVYDTETSFVTDDGSLYVPRNYDLRFHGPVTVREALGSSLNVPAVKVLDDIGFDSFYQLLELFGIHFEQSAEWYGLGITLGGGEVTLTNLTHAYSMLANRGMKTQVYGIESINYEKQEVYRHEFSKPTVLADSLAPHIDLVNDMLRDKAARATSFGLASLLDIHENVAVKTGTTKDFRDNWAFGYTPEITVGIWVGNNDNTPMEGVSGISGSIPILHDFFRANPKWYTDATWQMSDKITSINLCRLSGGLATSICPEVVTEFVLPEDAPREEDAWFRLVEIDKQTDLLVNDSCRNDVMSKVVLKLPTSLLAWARSTGRELMPDRYCDGTPVDDGNMPEFVTPAEGTNYLQDATLPLEAQKIPLYIEGSGVIEKPLLLDGVQIREKVSLPYKSLLDLRPGKHSLELGDISVSFTVSSD